MKNEMNAVVPLFIESERGHDLDFVPIADLPGTAENLLKDDKWLVVEKEDKTTEILTEMPKANEGNNVPASSNPSGEQPKSDNDNWKDTFKQAAPQETTPQQPQSSAPKKEENFEWNKVRSVTAINKAKGG